MEGGARSYSGHRVSLLYALAKNKKKQADSRACQFSLNRKARRAGRPERMGQNRPTCTCKSMGRVLSVVKRCRVVELRLKPISPRANTTIRAHLKHPTLTNLFEPRYIQNMKWD